MLDVAPSRTLQILHEAEGPGGLGDHEFTPYGLSMWAYARWIVAVRLAAAMTEMDWGERLSQEGESVRDRVAYVLRTLGQRAHGVPAARFPIVIFCSGVGNYPANGAYFNRLADHFADTFRDQTFLVEDSDRKTYHVPRQFPHLAYHDLLLVRAFAAGKLRPLPADDRRKIDAFVARLEALFGSRLGPNVYALVRAKLVKTARQCEAWRRHYTSLFDRLQPRLLLIEDGCYGARSHIIRWARERGIATAEYQHGYIGANHEAYNFAPELLASRYRANFPDYFLAYGDYWTRQIRIGSQVVVIGNPHLSETARRYARRSARRTVLFVSGAINTAMYRRVLPEIAASLPDDVGLVFRPHPMELRAMDDYGDVFARCGITVDRERMAYQSVADADLVIGDVSTLLFEATVFDKPVVVIDDEESRKIMPAGLFPFVRDFTTLAQHLERGAAPQAITANALWAPAWRDNYRAFVERNLARAVA